ncbi:MAG TPA: LytTR family DNA-binding domain-containing protein [Bacteroidales bacterium]|nr:LytTR family DNA-binding domain-containing protein [Bacteroidales bacterium]
MIKFDQPLPSYHNVKQNILRLILFTSVFALIFINIYAPFGADRWFNVTRLRFFTFSSLTILTGVLIVVISRIGMYNYCRRMPLLVWQFLIWIFAEIALMSLFYSLFEKYVLDDSREFPGIFKISLKNTALVLLLPYAISWLWLAWQDKKDQLAKLKDEPEKDGSQKDMIAFYDDKGILKFSVKRENLLYLESAENYVNVCYLNKDKISKYMLRDTLKKVEETFAGSDIVRCHRCYIVNFDKVKVIRRDKDGLKLELDVPSATDIPVSKTYVSSVMQTFSRYCKTGDVSN